MSPETADFKILKRTPVAVIDEVLAELEGTRQPSPSEFAEALAPTIDPAWQQLVLDTVAADQRIAVSDLNALLYQTYRSMADPVFLRRLLHRHLLSPTSHDLLVDIDAALAAATVGTDLLDKIIDEITDLIERSAETYSDAVVNAAARRGVSDAVLRALARIPPNAMAVQMAELSAGSLVTRITHGVRNDINQIISRGISQGMGPVPIARQLASKVGLIPAHQLAVDNYERQLIAQGVAPARVASLTRARAGRLLNWRTNNIARTELLSATNGGQMLLWRAKVRSGDLPSGLSKQWIITPDDRLCPLCAQMVGERAVVDLDAPFDTPRGLIDHPPMHPSCRCAIGIAFTDLDRPVPDVAAPTVILGGDPASPTVSSTLAKWRSELHKHQGPGPHPGTGSPQQAHAGEGAGEGWRSRVSTTEPEEVQNRARSAMGVGVFVAITDDPGPAGVVLDQIPAEVFEAAGDPTMQFLSYDDMDPLGRKAIAGVFDHTHNTLTLSTRPSVPGRNASQIVVHELVHGMDRNVSGVPRSYGDFLSHSHPEISSKLDEIIEKGSDMRGRRDPWFYALNDRHETPEVRKMEVLADGVSFYLTNPDVVTSFDTKYGTDMAGMAKTFLEVKGLGDLDLTGLPTNRQISRQLGITKAEPELDPNWCGTGPLLIQDLEVAVTIGSDWTGQVTKHQGPGPHPGTGSPQQAHAGEGSGGSWRNRTTDHYNIELEAAGRLVMALGTLNFESTKVPGEAVARALDEVPGQLWEAVGNPQVLFLDAEVGNVRNFGGAYDSKFKVLSLNSEPLASGSKSPEHVIAHELAHGLDAKNAASDFIESPDDYRSASTFASRIDELVAKVTPPTDSSSHWSYAFGEHVVSRQPEEYKLHTRRREVLAEVVATHLTAPAKLSSFDSSYGVDATSLAKDFLADVGLGPEFSYGDRVSKVAVVRAAAGTNENAWCATPTLDVLDDIQDLEVAVTPVWENEVVKHPPTPHSTGTSQQAHAGDGSGSASGGSDWRIEPGTSEIPEGAVRLFHMTWPEHVEAIRSGGIRLGEARGESYGEPNQVWAAAGDGSAFTQPLRPTVEFWMRPDELGIGRDSDPDWLERTRAHVTMGDVGTDRIVAIHEPWHAHRRYLEGETVSSLASIGLVHETDSGPVLSVPNYMAAGSDEERALLSWAVDHDVAVP